MTKSSIFINEIGSVLNLSDVGFNNDRKIISLLDLKRCLQSFNEYYAYYMGYASNYMKNIPNFRLFYFDEIGNVIIHLGYDKDKIKRELILKYVFGGYEIFNKDILDDNEFDYFNVDFDFFCNLVNIGKYKASICRNLNTVCGDFNVNLSCKKINILHEVGHNYLAINYSFCQDAVIERMKMGIISKSLYYKSSEGVFEIDTNIYKLRKMLSENNNENIVKLFDNLYIYLDDLSDLVFDTKKKILKNNN